LPDAVLALFGPTGVGKTAVAIELADLLRGRGEDPVAVSADALQVYDGLQIVTGAATAADQRRLEHRLLGFVPVTETFNVGDYMERAHAEIDTLLAEGRRPIVVGGTGLYLRAALADLSLRPAEPGQESELWSAQTRHPTVVVCLTMEREALYERIDRRVDAIVAAGAEAEVRAADAAGPSRTARKALGFHDLLASDVGSMRRRSRNYAKRQITWMRKMPDVTEVDTTGRSAADVAAEVGHMLAAH
jgi:tRNA dimethylallyltransferase